jgi:SAM-dependent methyltransferase
MNQSQLETDAVAARYARRQAADLYSMLRPEVYMAFQERQRELIKVLNRYAPAPIAELRVLEIGCGSGGNLLELIRLGFNPENLVANELLPDRARAARHNLPVACRIFEGDASGLKFEAGHFHIVYQSTVFTSLLDAAFQADLAAKMWHWVAPGGGVLWYDFVYDNPRNSDVRGVPVGRVRTLFPEAEIATRRVTLAPPISRRVCRVHPAAYRLFNALLPLRTHVLCWMGKRAAIQSAGPV